MTARILQPFLITFLIMGLQLQASSQKKTLKHLRGNWHIVAAMQNGDTLFDLQRMDSTFIFQRQVEKMRKKRELRNDDRFSTADSLMVIKRVKQQLATIGQMNIEFKKDSVFDSRMTKDAPPGYGKYWFSPTADTMYLRDDKKPAIAEWLFTMDPKNDLFTMRLLTQDLIFVMKKD